MKASCFQQRSPETVKGQTYYVFKYFHKRDSIRIEETLKRNFPIFLMVSCNAKKEFWDFFIEVDRTLAFFLTLRASCPTIDSLCVLLFLSKFATIGAIMLFPKDFNVVFYDEISFIQSKLMDLFSLNGADLFKNQVYSSKIKIPSCCIEITN